MKRFLFQSILFVIFSIIVYGFLLISFGKFLPQNFKPNLSYKKGGYGHLFSRLEDAKNSKDIDVLVLGSSHAYRGVDTRIFEKRGVKMFNLGSSSQSPIQSYYLLKKYLPILNPKLLIYDVFPVTLASDGVESTLDLVSNDDFNFELAKIVLKTKNVKVYNTAIYAWYNQLVNRKKPFMEQHTKGDDKYISGGFVEKKINYHKFETFEKSTLVLKDYQIEYLDSICQYTKNKGIKLLLVNAPINSLMYKSYTNFDSIDNILSNKAMYINYNKILYLNDSLDFYDSHHLNQNGVEIYNKKLVEKIDYYLK